MSGLITSTVFNDLKNDRPMTADEIKRYAQSLDVLLEEGAPVKPGKRVRDWLATRVSDPAKRAAARARLIRVGIPESILGSFPADQVILLDEKRECEARFDNATKIMNFSAWQFEALLEQAKPYSGPALFADALFPGQYTVRRVQGRFQSSGTALAASRRSRLRGCTRPHCNKRLSREAHRMPGAGARRSIHRQALRL